jgi:D-3-phosphoglycerate dehydrogenase
MPRILFIDSNHPILHQTLMSAGFTCDLNYNWTEQEIADNLHLYHGIVIRSRITLTPAIIGKGTQLKFIARAGAGMENIATAYAESINIKCINSPEGNKDAVAEHALGMLLTLFNNLNTADAQVRQGKWIREANRGTELKGKTVAIIGCGNMGSAFAELLKAFGVTVIAYDKYKTINIAGVRQVQMPEVFDTADVVSLHLPLTDETTNLLNDAYIKQFKKNIYIINTARGKNVNTAHLLNNIDSGKVLGACLDVLEFEGTSFENISAEMMQNPTWQKLITCNKIILTPHIAGWTTESNQKIAEVLAEKIRAVLSAR